MSRQRFIYPEIFASPDFTGLTFGARLLFIGMFTTADDYGRGRATPEALKIAVFPSDSISGSKIAAWLSEIEALGMVRLYSTSRTPDSGVRPTQEAVPTSRTSKSDVRVARKAFPGSRTLWYDIPTWNKYQSPRYKAKSKAPSFEQRDQNYVSQAATYKDTDPPGVPRTGLGSGRGSGGEGKGGVGEGSPRLKLGGEDHADGLPPVSDLPPDPDRAEVDPGEYTETQQTALDALRRMRAVTAKAPA